MRKGTLVTVEGIDGSGKSSHMQWLAEYLSKSLNCSVLSLREPGSTELGERLRTLLLEHEMLPITEMLLACAARYELIGQKILPCLLKGNTVLCDRFADSTYAYQCAGKKTPKSLWYLLQEFIQRNESMYVKPDLTIFFDLPPEIAAQRIQARGDQQDRFERQNQAFFDNVRNGYLDILRRRENVIHIDAHQSLQSVRSELELKLANFLGQPNGLLSR